MHHRWRTMAIRASFQTLIDRLRGRLRTFGLAAGGNVVMTFALATVPMIGFVGSAIDYSRGNSAKAAMQGAIDATGLILSKNTSTITKQRATDIFNAQFHRTDVTNIDVNPVYSNTNGSQVVVTATAIVPTTFMKVMGFSELPITATTTIKWGNTRLRVALVLDNTGSMGQDGKLAALKTATNNLLTQLQNAATTPADVYVSIIPFSKDVNVDSVNYSQNWVDWTDWDGLNGHCNNNNYSTYNTCSVTHNHTWTPDNHNTWNGCITDRGTPGNPPGTTGAPSPQNTDTNVVAPVVGNKDTLFPAEQFSGCTQRVMALNYNWSSMTTLVNNMVANGNTNQGIGLDLGWFSLVGGGPFPTPPVIDGNYQYSKVIILLTDGLNTQNRWYNQQSQIDTRQQMTCNNINAAGITLYTVQVNTRGDPTSQLLRNCAGSPGRYPDADKFFLLTSSNAIITTFQQIGTSLSNLRVAQ
jgi:Flp pilus assembly protein TadG